MRLRFLAVAALAASAPTASGQGTPCTRATTACEEWVTSAAVRRGRWSTRTYPLDTPNLAITRALIMVHGAGRNADHYFETATAAGFLAGALDNTIIIAPRFIAGARQARRRTRSCGRSGGDSWRSGGMSPIESDALVVRLRRRDRAQARRQEDAFPNLTKIVVAGHSAGGQFATATRWRTRCTARSASAVTYVVANPSSYAWPAAVRPLPTGDADPGRRGQGGAGAGRREGAHELHVRPVRREQGARLTISWPAGLENRAGYTAGMSDDQLKKQLVERPTTYLLGQVDVLPLGGFDSSPSAMAQGPTRRARGEAFFKYVTETLGAKHKAIIVPECGHNDRCIFTTDIVFPVIFP